MAKKKKRSSIAAVLVEAVSDVANAASVAATGSEIGVLELAAEDELKPNQTKRARRVKAVPKKRPRQGNPGSRLKRNLPESAGSAHKPRLPLFPIAIKERTAPADAWRRSRTEGDLMIALILPFRDPGEGARTH